MCACLQHTGTCLLMPYYVSQGRLLTIFIHAPLWRVVWWVQSLTLICCTAYHSQSSTRRPTCDYCVVSYFSLYLSPSVIRCDWWRGLVWDTEWTGWVGSSWTRGAAVSMGLGQWETGRRWGGGGKWDRAEFRERWDELAQLGVSQGELVIVQNFA